MGGAHAAREGGRAGILLLLALAAYFAIEAVLRVFYASSLGVDEAELLVTTQAAKAGYGSQPPLYSWIQIAAFQLLGAGIPALALVKNLLLFATFAFMFLSARLVFGEDFRAVVTTLALFTIPQLAWESQRALSHTVIVVAMATATLYLFLLVMRSGRTRHYLLLGVAFALGMLSKYNYALFVVVLFLAAMTIPAFRPRILSLRMLAALVLAALLLVPHLLWFVSNPGAALTRVDKFEIVSGFTARLSGFAAALEGIVNYALLPTILLLAVAFVPLRRAGVETASSAPGWPEGKALIVRLAGTALLLVLVLVLITGATEVRDRWLQPLLFMTPLALFLLFEGRMVKARCDLLATISIVIAIGFMIGLAASHLLPDLFGRAPRATVPYGALSSQIRDLGFRNGHILSDSSYVVGNLKLRFPDSSVSQGEYGLWPAPVPPQDILLAWDSHADEPPGEILALYRRLCGPDAPSPPAPESLAAPFEHSTAQTYRLRVVLMPMCTPAETAPEAASAAGGNSS